MMVEHEEQNVRHERPLRGQNQAVSLSADQQELAEVCARFADVCDYFSRQNMDLPPSVLEDIGRVSKLSVPERIAAMKRLNRSLMEYIDHVGQGSRIRQ
jgi:hypothetical protein